MLCILDKYVAGLYAQYKLEEGNLKDLASKTRTGRHVQGLHRKRHRLAVAYLNARI